MSNMHVVSMAISCADLVVNLSQVLLSLFQSCRTALVLVPIFSATQIAILGGWKYQDSSQIAIFNPATTFSYQSYSLGLPRVVSFWYQSQITLYRPKVPSNQNLTQRPTITNLSLPQITLYSKPNPKSNIQKQPQNHIKLEWLIK